MSQPFYTPQLLLIGAQGELQRMANAMTPNAEAKLLSGITVNTTLTTIQHGLGYVPFGWYLVAPKSGLACWQAQASDATNIYLMSAGAPLLTDILVF